MKTKTQITNKADEVNPNIISRKLMLGERMALAAASMAIHTLPGVLNQASDAADMQAMLVDPASVERGRLHSFAGGAHFR